MVLLLSLSSSKPVSASNLSPSVKTTCLDIRAQFPSGIARDKKAIGLRKYPKAKIDKTLYAAYSTFDLLGNKNGIACDKSENPKWRWDTKFDGTFGGIYIDVSLTCNQTLLNFGPNSVVGYADLSFGTNCSYTMTNHDTFYTFNGDSWSSFFQCCSIYLVYDSTITNPYGKVSIFKFGIANMAAPTLKPGETRTKSGSDLGRFSGTRAEIELLFQRLNNGLQPDVYFGFEFRGKANNGGGLQRDEQEACFFTGTNPIIKPTKVIEELYCRTESGSFIWE